MKIRNASQAQPPLTNSQFSTLNFQFQVTHSPATPHATSAFTLAELVIVLSILGLLSAIVVPRFANAIDYHRLEAANTRLHRDLTLAYMRARATSESQTVRFDTAASAYELLDIEDPNHAGQPYRVVLAGAPYHSTFVLVSVGGDTDLVYDGFGQPDTSGMVIMKCGKYQSITYLAEPDGDAGTQIYGP